MFSWYLSQGFMSNIIFESYEGPYQLGVYGIEILIIVRRFDGLFVYDNFQYLMDLGTWISSKCLWKFIHRFWFFGLIIAFLGNVVNVGIHKS